ncbi:MAG: hypothetical protein ABEK59_02825 [Halobacteria archaeon]
MADPNFSDRFIKDNPALQNKDIKNTADSELLKLSGELQRMVDAVRRTDAFIKNRATVKQIYFAITEHSDPKIGGLLAAAKDPQTGERLFDSVQQVKELMYPYSQFENVERNIFNDLIRQASVNFAASLLVGQLSSAVGQDVSSHEEYLYRIAKEEIDRIIQTVDVNAVTASREQQTEETERPVLFFEQRALVLEEPLTVEVFLSGTTSGWETVGTYNSRTSSGEIVAAIADKINALTLNSTTSNILAAPNLSGKRNTHSIYFQARRFSNTVSAEVVSVRFSSRAPFQWGPRLEYLNNYEINSVLIATSEGGATSTSDTQQESQGSPSVIYIRRKPVNNTGEPIDAEGNIISGWRDSQIRFRVSTQQEPITIPLPAFGGEQTRASQMALALLNKLYELKGDIRCLGSIVKADAKTEDQPAVALELIPYRLMKTTTWLVLDLLEFPPDLEVALGDLYNPLTPYSDQPRSVRVETKFDLEGRTPAAYEERSGDKNKPQVISRAKSSYFKTINERMREWFRW